MQKKPLINYFDEGLSSYREDIFSLLNILGRGLD